MSYKEEWKEYRFSDFVKINPKISLKSKNKYSFIEMKDLDKGKKNVYPSQERILKGGSRFENDDVLFARITPCLENGKVGKATKLKNGVGFGSTEFLVFRRKEEISDKNFIYYLSCWHEVQDFAIRNMVGSSGRQRVARQVFDDLKLKLPTLPIQNSIASILSAFDEKIEVNRQMNTTLEAMAQAMFREMCLPKDEKNLEDGWSSEILENHTKVDRGLSYKGAGLTNAEDEKGLPMHNLNSVFEGGGYKFKGIKYYNGKYRERHLIEAGDIIVTNTEQGHKYLLIGCPAIVPSYFGKKGIFSQHIYKISPKEDTTVTRPFLYYLLMQKIVREQVISCTNGTTVNMLSKDGLQMPQFFLPPKSVIQKFTEFVKPIIQQKEELHKQNQDLAKTRDLLLPKLMNGEIEV